MRRALNTSLGFLAALTVAQALAPSTASQHAVDPPACGRVLADPYFPRPLLSETPLEFSVLRYLDFDGDGVVEPIGYAQPPLSTPGVRQYQLYRGAFGNGGKITYEALLPPIIEARASPVELLTGDIDGDGVNDLAAYWRDNNQKDTPKYLDMHRGVGNGFVAPAERTTLPARQASGSPLLADFDGDGRLDFVVQWKHCVNNQWCPEVQLEVWSWDGFQSFVRRFAHLGPASTDRAPAVLDLDGDGLEDLVTEHSRSLGVRYGDGVSILEPLQLHPLPYRSNGVFAMDLDGSGRERLVVVEGPPAWFFSPVRLHRIESLVPQVVDGWTQTILSNLFHSPVVADDLDGDGRTDLRFRQPGGGLFFGGSCGFHILWADGDEPLTDGQRSRTTPRILASLDLDGDGMRDVLTADSYPPWPDPRPTFYPAVAPRQFDEGVYTTPLSYGESDEPFINTSIGDVNNDGLDDVLTLTLYHRAFTIALAVGDGTFDVRDLPRPEENWWDADLHDMDGDGNLDIAVVPGYLSSEIGTARGRGDGTFDPIRMFPLGDTFHRFWFGDLNGDGRTDFLAERYFWAWPVKELELVAFLAGEGAFKRGPSTELTVRYTFDAVLADVDGDGREDLIHERSPDLLADPTRISWRSSLGDGSFGAPADVLDETFPTYIEQIVVTDFDLDRKSDLLVRLRNWDYISIRGDGRGGFLAVWRGDPVDWPDILTDVNGDGRPDLVQREPDTYNHDSTRTYETYTRLGDGLGGFGGPLDPKSHSFGGHSGRFRSRGGRDLVRVAAIDGRFQLEISPNLGEVLSQDAAPPEVEVGVTPIVTSPTNPGVVDVQWQLTMVPIDECDSAPRITRSVVDLVPLGEGTTVLFVPQAEQEARIFERGVVQEVVLSGPDEAAARAAFQAARNAGGFPFESFGTLRLAAAGQRGPPGTEFGVRGRLTQQLKLRDGLVVEAAVFRPGGDVTFSIDAADRSGRVATTRVSYLEFRREAIAEACASANPEPLCAAP